MQVKTRVKAGGINLGNHNETLVRAKGQPKGLTVKTRVKAGTSLNHNETLVRAKGQPTGLKVKTRVKAGGLALGNHNETLVRDMPRKRARV
jgi:hypothetical protein